MAKLPNGERARIPMEKLTDYCLNPDHPCGKDKARVFASLLGITRDGADELAALVRQAATDGDITKEAVTIFGRYYRVDWAIPARGNVVLRTMWEIAPGEEIPRLISAFMHSCKGASMGHPKPFDVVASLQPILPESLQLTDECYDLSAGLAAGTVGTVVEVLSQHAELLMCLVEFSDARGCGYAFATVPAETLLILHYAPSEPIVARQ